MDSPEIPPLIRARHQVEEFWASKLEEAFHRYRAATVEYRKTLKEQAGLPPGPDGALERTRQAEAAALAEYKRVLRVFTDLTLYHKMPEEPSAENAESV